MSKNGGNMAEAGAVGWMFSRKGEISVPKEAASEDKLLDVVLEAGAEDLKDDGSAWYIVTPPDALEKVKEALTKASITPASAEIAMLPQNYIRLTGAQATQMQRQRDAALVGSCYSNADGRPLTAHKCEVGCYRTRRWPSRQRKPPPRNTLCH